MPQQTEPPGQGYLIYSSKQTNKQCITITDPLYKRRECTLERASNSTQIPQFTTDSYGIRVWTWGVGKLKTLKLYSKLCVGIHVAHVFPGVGGGEGMWSVSVTVSELLKAFSTGVEAAPSECRRPAWQLPVVSHRPNGGTEQMLHFLLCGQTYWTRSLNLKTQQRCPNLWKTCRVRKITFTRNQLILCIFQFRSGSKSRVAPTRDFFSFLPPD